MGNYCGNRDQTLSKPCIPSSRAAVHLHLKGGMGCLYAARMLFKVTRRKGFFFPKDISGETGFMKCSIEGETMVFHCLTPCMPTLELVSYKANMTKHGVCLRGTSRQGLAFLRLVK